MATFGDTTQESTSFTAVQYEMVGRVGSPANNGIVTSLNGYMCVPTGTVVSMGLYTTAGALVVKSSDMTGTGAGTGWQTFPVTNTAVTAGTNYAILLQTNTASSATWYRSTGHTSGDSLYYDNTSYQWPASVTFLNSSSWYSTYATYTPMINSVSSQAIYIPEGLF